MRDPAFLFYSSDFLTGAMLMTNEQVGKYIRLLCLQHQKGHLTKKDLLFICVNEDENEIIFEKFKEDEDGKYFNKRLDEESEKRSKYTESRRKNLETKDSHMEDHMAEHMKTHVAHRKGVHMENENENENIDINIDEKPCKKIIEYLNLKAGTSYRHTSKKTQELIQARLNENFTVENFYIVIDKKINEWNETEMQKFIRPETLFSNKFEGYLNQVIIKAPKNGNKKPGNVGNFEQRKITEDYFKDEDLSKYKEGSI